MKDVDLETITDALSWYKFWQLNGFNHIRAKQKTSQETEKSLRKFLEPQHKPTKVIPTYKSLEFGKSCEDLSGNHCTSTPHRSETNGTAERAVRRIKEGTSVVLLQSSLDEKWWADSMECYCNMRNMQDLLSDEKTPYERRFGEPVKGPIIPLGSMIEYHPITPKVLSRLHQFGKTVLPRIFLGYVCIVRGRNLERRRSRSVLVSFLCFFFGAQFRHLHGVGNVTQHPLERTGGLPIRGKTLRHCTLQPSNSWAENPTLRRAARVPTPSWPGYSTLLRAARAPLQPPDCCPHLE